MVVHVHERVGAAAKFWRAFGNQIERLAQAGQRTVLDAIGDYREHSIEQRGDRAPAPSIGAYACGISLRPALAGSNLCSLDCVRTNEKNAIEKVLNALGKLRTANSGPPASRCMMRNGAPKRAMVGLEGVGARDGIAGGEQAIDGGVFASAFGVGGGALIEAQNHRHADRDGREPLRRRFERELEDRGLPSAGKDAQARDRRAEIGG